MLTPGTVELVIQGGAVGLMLVFIVMGYRLARDAMARVAEFVNNHMAHNTRAVEDNTKATREVRDAVRAMSDRMSERQTY